MFAVVLVVPLIWMMALAGLSWLEEHTLGPQERAAKIASLLDGQDPEAIERQVSEMFAHIGRAKRVTKRRTADPSAPVTGIGSS